MQKIFAVCFFFWIIFVCGCKKQDLTPDSITHRAVLIYMAGDNSLSYEVYQELEALKKGWKEYNGKLVVYGDTNDGPPFLIEIKNTLGVVQADTIIKYQEHNAADAGIFRQVIDDFKNRYPATSYGLVMFSHGSGWLPAGTLLRPQWTGIKMARLQATPNIVAYSMAMDNSNELELGAMADVLPDHCFDFIIFESCFMAGVEVVAALRNKAEWIVGSAAETLAPGFTSVYDRLLPHLFATTNMEQHLKSAAQIYVAHCKMLSGAYQSATMTVIKTAAFQKLITWAKANATYRIADIGGLQYFDRYAYHLFFDLEEYLKLISDASSHAALDSILQELVVYKEATPFFMIGGTYNGFQIKKHSGLTTYIPQTHFTYLNQKYTATQWATTIAK